MQRKLDGHDQPDSLTPAFMFNYLIEKKKDNVTVL